MPTFRKKPVEIEARQVPGVNDDDPFSSDEVRDDVRSEFDALVQWCGGESVNDAVDGRCILIHTLEGSMKARSGDWIIRGVQGEFYPCDPAIFAETYEAVA